jgi:CheY-like chemotaxis protein
MRSEAPLSILLVEDNPADANMLKSMLRESGLCLSVTVVGDGQLALNVLTRCIAGDPPPDLVILDLNLPKVHGYEVLSFLKSSPLRSIPVVVMTGSLNTEDEAKALSMGAAMYIIKPCTLEEYDVIVARLREELAPRAGGRERGNAPDANKLGMRSTASPMVTAPSSPGPAAPWHAPGDCR